MLSLVCLCILDYNFLCTERFEIYGIGLESKPRSVMGPLGRNPSYLLKDWSFQSGPSYYIFVTAFITSFSS
jgi:hypothetical protein